MKTLLWAHSDALDTQVSRLISATGTILFREQEPDNLLAAARREKPMLILLAPGPEPKTLVKTVEALATHPDTRWTPLVLLCDVAESKQELSSLLERGADAIIDCQNQEKLLQAEFRALHRGALRLATIRSTRLTDEKTGFYHQSFLLDQLQVLCRKKRRDGISFCILFLELKGDETEIHKAALSVSNTVRGADLFGRWESELFAVLLPSSQPTQAHLLAKRCLNLLSGQAVKSKAALVSSDSGPVEADRLIEAALNTLDQAWRGDGFLWTWDGDRLDAQPQSL